MFADDAGLDFAADQEHRRAAAVIGALAAVFLGPAAKLGKGHDQHAVAMAAGGQILVEGGDGAGDLAE